MYKILTQIHLNYKFKKITFKNILNHGLTDCLAKEVKILDGMKFIWITNFKRLRLNIFRFTDCPIAWLRELKSLMAWNAVRCLPQFLHTCPINTNGYDSSNWWSIGTNGTIGTNRKAPYSNGSVGAYASN